MRLAKWFPVAAAVLVLTGAPPGQAQDRPDRADPTSGPTGASPSGHMRFKAWTQPFCVGGSGTLIVLSVAELHEAVDRGICVGVVDVHRTASCDTRTGQCNWPCDGDPGCREEWEVEPRYPYADYADAAMAVAEAAWDDPEALRADGLAKVREYPDNFLADTREDASPPSPRRDVETPAAVVADSARAGGLHGSIAFSQDDDGAYAWGIAWSFDSAAGAQSEALGQCREYGGRQCAQAGWFQEACGALAIGSVNGYGTGWGATISEAERDALAQCRAVNDDCRIEVARCSQSEQAGGSGQLDSEDTAVSRDTAGTSDASCGGWEATHTATWNEEGLRRGGLNNVPIESWGATKAEAEDYAQRGCSSYSSHPEWSLLLVSCDVSEAKCVRPLGAPAEQDQSAAPAAKHLCGVSEHLIELEASNQPGCRFCYDGRHDGEWHTYPTHWSGSCSNGVANGTGTITWPSRPSFTEAVAAFSAGLPNGDWVVTLVYREGHQLMREIKGAYVEGKREGDWAWRAGTCGVDTFSNDVSVHAEYYECE